MTEVQPLSKLRSRPRVPKEGGRIRCEAHLVYVRRQYCCVPLCRERPCEPHHLRSCTDPEAMGLKSGDNWTVPLCHAHHVGPGGVQDSPNEQAWGDQHGVHLFSLAALLWADSVRAKRHLPRDSQRL
jgi:hypothetical protein